MSKCITCEQSVIVVDPFESGRCEVCFSEFMKLRHNIGLTFTQYWGEEKQSRAWYSESSDDQLRNKAKLAQTEQQKGETNE